MSQTLRENEDLPIRPILPALVAALAESKALVLTAPPGAGKSTCVPGAILDAGILNEGRLVMLEPRRMAARACAGWMARLRGEQVGQTVGYKVRFDERMSPSTRILVVTEGILTRRLVSDPFLEGISCVVVDEFHERSVHVDLVLSFVRELIEVRDDLKLVVMSATMDAKKVSRYLGDCPVICAEGRQFPLHIEHVKQMDERPLHVRMTAAVAGVLKEDSQGGDLLAFLPGMPEIRRLTDHLKTRTLPGTPEIVPLYGALDAAQQDRVLRPGTRRRIVLATNIAQTSLTIPGVTSVVDSGLVKISRWDPNIGFDRLETVKISRQSAEQRAGRAGRIAPGQVLRLWTKAEDRGRREADEPEILRVDLASTLLMIMAFHPGDPRKFELFERPSERAFEAGLELLELLGAYDLKKHVLTSRGRTLVSFPVHPRLGVILERAAKLGVLKQGATLAALTAERDILRRSQDGGEHERLTVDCDIEWRSDRLGAFLQGGGRPAMASGFGISPQAASLAVFARDQLLSAAKSRWPKEPVCGVEQISSGRLLLAGFPDRVCKRRSPGGDQGVMVGGRGVRLSERSGVREGEFFLALDADAGRRGERSTTRVDRASRITIADLEAEHSHLMTRAQSAVFDRNRQLVVGVRQRLFCDLVIEERPDPDVDPEVIAAALFREAGDRLAEVFKPLPEAQELIERLRFAAREIPEESWPDVSEEALKTLLQELCANKRSFEELKKIDWRREIAGLMDYRLTSLLEAEIPAKVEVPSGSEIRLDYSQIKTGDDTPVLAARLQELFGLGKTPRIARGRILLTLHLLAPNGRPAQVTRDLTSFWNSTYSVVRSELKGRYPKHDWPTDPWTAKPTSRAKRRK
jgi:ATP-dependent RNA helicase HrpB